MHAWTSGGALAAPSEVAGGATLVSPLGEARSIRLIDGFECTIDGKVVELPRGCQRLVAFLALWERPVLRTFVSGSLWPDSDDAHSNACLRSSLDSAGKALATVPDSFVSWHA